MKGADHKTARFKEILAQAGTPESYIPWSDPERDPHFRQASRQGRVLTVHQTNRRNRRDFGEVGYVTGANMLYFIFPKSLESFTDRKIIGIDYNLLPIAKRVIKSRRPRDGN